MHARQGCASPAACQPLPTVPAAHLCCNCMSMLSPVPHLCKRARIPWCALHQLHAQTQPWLPTALLYAHFRGWWGCSANTTAAACTPSPGKGACTAAGGGGTCCLLERL
eukprot:scaffold3467_cov22-Tisochrysis_lutea.AAC.1